MTHEEFKAIPGIIAWLDEGMTRGYCSALSDLIDEEIGDTGYHNRTPHEANINLGIQEAVRRVRAVLRDPVRRRRPAKAMPQATYGVGEQKEEGDEQKS